MYRSVTAEVIVDMGGEGRGERGEGRGGEEEFTNFRSSQQVL